jgi:opacity protein-like surface antigen
MLDERNQTPTTDPSTQRRRSYGSGVSPVGFRAYFRPQSRIQPYLSGDGGFLYFDERVLSPQGSQWMYTIDYGAGLTFFRTKRQSFSIGYRYQHLSNANISHHNPGTDANTFYVQVSRYRSKGYR